ncbi:MAG TPA: CHAD domain-containing protein, partial [Lacibacter sp.]|nr:CHAD domain-containing protein [Lacibacter sp.]
YLKKEISRLQREERPENWHELRKQIKQLLYTWHWLENRQQLLLLSRREYAYYDELQEAIGHWHDLLDIRDWLTNKQFFFHSDHTVRQSFGRCWVRLSHDTAQQDRVVRKLLARAPAVAAS